jgi:hypothetical protein
MATDLQDSRKDIPGPPNQKRMVGWYDPGQLMKTGVQVLVSDLIGTRFDARREEALAGAADTELIDYSTFPADDFWFDYMADTGDGWKSTFHMARLVSQPLIQIKGVALPRGRFLLLGGDEVYPVASKQEYQDRLIAPFEAASPPASDDQPAQYDLYAIPGNHDWYDGLVSFLRQFAQERRIGSWGTRQKRSYFALKLPRGWWLWAVDTQLENDLDRPQVEYFRGVVDKMKDGDRLIVCIPEPDWLYGKMQNDPTLMNNLGFLLGKWVLGRKKVKAYLTLSGDLHHYRRHEHISDPNQQKIVAGGGGAFLHPTHGNNFDEVIVYDDIFRLKKETQFPKTSTSFWLTFGNLLFLFKNLKFGVLTGVLYLLLGWTLTHVEWNAAFLFSMAMQSTVRLALILLLYVGFYYFTKAGWKFNLLWGALAHGSAHIAAALWLSDVANRWCGVADVTSLNNWRALSCRLAILYLGGHIVGSTIMGVYLLISLNLFRHHQNEAFSALKIENYKNFLRLHIKEDGTLEIFPIGVPNLSKAPILLEGPIRITPPEATT